VPCPSIHTPAQTEVTDSDDPEAAFRRAVQLYAAWRQPHPTATRTALLELSPTSSAANERILYAVGLSVLSHTRGRVLLTMHITVADAPPGNPPGPRRTGVLQVWDLWTGEPSTNLEGRGDTPLTAAVHGAQRVAELRVKSRSEAVLDAASGSITGLFRLAIAEREPDALCVLIVCFRGGRSLMRVQTGASTLFGLLMLLKAYSPVPSTAWLSLRARTAL
jgi:hypothetical protein